MENNIPEWFDNQQFTDFLTEGELTQLAYSKSLRRFALANKHAREELASTPLKYMARAQRHKNALKAAAMRQAARDYESAKNIEQQRKTMRYSIKQEDVNLDSEFENFLAEARKSASQKTISLHGEESAGQKAASKNPTGNPKKQNALRRKIQRERQDRAGNGAPDRKSEKQKEERKDTAPRVERKEKVSDTAGRADPSNYIGVKIKTGRERGKIQIIPKADYKPAIHELLVGKDSKGKGATATKSELEKLASKPEFRGTKSSSRLGISKKTEKGEERRRKEKEEEGTSRGGRKEKPEGRKTKAEEAKAKKSARSAEEGKTDQRQDDEMQLQQRFALRPKNGALIVFQNQGSSGQRLPYSVAETSGVIAQMAEQNPKMNNQLKKLYSERELEEIAQTANQYPEIQEIGIQQKIAMIQHAIQTNEKIAKMAEGMDPNQYSEEFTMLQTSKLRACSKNSEIFQMFGATDKTPKSDIALVPTVMLSSIVSKIKSKKCNFTKEEMEAITQVSVKKGSDAQLMGAQEKETIAMLEAVSIKMQNFMSSPDTAEMFQKLLLSGKGENADYMFEMKNAIEILKQISRIVTSNAATFQGNITYTLTKDPLERQKLASSNPAAVAALAEIENKNKELEEAMKKIFEVDIIKALIIHEAMTGDSKFEMDPEKPMYSPIGRATGFMLMNDQGNITGMMQIPDSKMLLEGRNSDNDAVRKFYVASKFFKFDPSFKPRYNKTKNMTALKPVSRIRGDKNKTLSDAYDIILDDKLDVLFETQFVPYDREIITTSNQMNPEAGETTPATDDELDPEFVPFGGQSPEEFAKSVNYNIFEVLKAAGIDLSTFRIQPFDAGELGLRISSMDNPARNIVTVNGKEFSIPIIGVSLVQEMLDEYNEINDKYVSLVENGMDIEEANELMQEELMNTVLLEKKRNYKREYKLFHSKPEQRKKRSNRVLARRKMAKKYGKRALKGKDIDHKDGNALNNGDSNLRVRSINSNRADNKQSRKKTLSEGNWKQRLDGSYEYTKFLLDITPGQIIDKALMRILSKNKGKSK